MGVCGGEATGESCCFVVAHLYEKRTMYQCKVDMDMLNAVKSVLADILSFSPSSEQRWSCSQANQD